MRLYMILDESESILDWAGSMADGRKAKKARAGAKEIREIDFPTKKEDLLPFLKTHFVSLPGTPDDKD
jgi:hypothetical protein